MFDDDFGIEDLIEILPDDTGQTGTDPTTGGGTGSGNLDLNTILTGINRLFQGTSPFGKAGAVLAAGGIGKLLERMLGGGQQGPAGYQGGIPVYTASRQQTSPEQQRPVTYESLSAKPGEMAAAVMVPKPYRPGQGGIRYFTPMTYTATGRDMAAPVAGAVAGGTPASTSTAAPAKSTVPASTIDPNTYTGSLIDPRESGSGTAADFASLERAAGVSGNAAGGYMPSGIAMLARGGSGNRYLRGPGDGVSDSIPAKFERSGQPARLADGEFVIDARTVSELGNGSSEAGARKLYAMLDRVHSMRKQAKRGKPSGADRELNKLVRGK